MRQAGRYMPEYRALRAKHGFLDLVRSPDLAAEITLQPVKAFEVDAAIVFADILPLLECLGLEIAFAAGDGPTVRNPVRSEADVTRLTPRPPAEVVSFTLEAIRRARRALNGVVPLIGFSGAPFTLACYAIEGVGGKGFTTAVNFMRTQPRAWHALMEKLAGAVGDYLVAQAAAGAQALQMFDSWAGLPAPEEYREFVLPYSAAALARARSGAPGVPVIHFSTRTTTAERLPLVRRAGGDVIGIDAGMTLAEAWRILGDDVAVQGNLAPDLMTGPAAPMKQAAAQLLDSVRGRPGHIFNLGHGVPKETPVERVAELVDFVHAYSSRREGNG